MNSKELRAKDRSKSDPSFSGNGLDDDDDDEADVETPKAVDNIQFVRLSPPSPPPLKLQQNNYVKGFQVPTLAVKIPAQVSGEDLKIS